MKYIKYFFLTLILLFTISCSSKTNYVTVSKDSIDQDALQAQKELYTPSNAYAGEAWYDQVDTYAINELQPRSSFGIYSNINFALKALKTSLDDITYLDDDNYLLLDGQWYFYYADNPMYRLKDVYGQQELNYIENWDTSGWDIVNLPGCIETQYNDDYSFKYLSPTYTNTNYPWLNNENIVYGGDGLPVAATSFNPVGHYKRYFNITQDQLNKHIVINLEGVSSAFYLYINGQFVGYSEDSYTNSYFDITDYLQLGQNSIAIEVYKYCDGSYLENQDMIRLSGIFRSIYLIFDNDINIDNIYISSNDINNYQANYSLDLSIVSNSDITQEDITVYIYDKDNNIVESNTYTISLNKGDNDITLDNILDNVHLWNIDDPYLYKFIIKLDDNENCYGLTYGFRNLSWDENYIYINDHKTILNGINRHEMDLYNGKAIDADTIINDLTLIKQANINIIRLSHYPNNMLTYDIADELGILLVDEANIESHGGEIELSIPGNNSIYINEMLYRIDSMIYRDYNHCSIIIYSYGNESTYTTYPLDDNYPFYVIAKHVLALDDSRLRMYERDNRYTKDNREESIVDIASSQYYDIDSMIDAANSYEIPYVQQEYAHAMGNALGNSKEYLQAIKDSNMAGGFVWDFKDQSIITNIDDTLVYGNGSDWNDALNDGSFCGNGIVSANNQPQNEYYQLKVMYQYIDINYSDNVLTITNNYPTINLNKFNMVIIGLNNDIEVYRKSSVIDCQTGQSITRNLDINFNSNSNSLNTIQVYFYDNDNNWVAYKQFILNKDYKNTLDFNNDISSLVYSKDNNILSITNNTNSFKVTIDSDSGRLLTYSKDDQLLIEDGFSLNLLRSPIDNDPDINVNFMQLQYTGTYSKVKVNTNKMEFSYTFKPDDIDITLKCNYKIISDGSIKFNYAIKVGKENNLGPLLTVGIKANINKDYSEYTYFGNGYDCYIDRDDSCVIGRYSQNIDDNDDNYLTPQALNHKTDVYNLSIYNNKQLDFIFADSISMYYQDNDPYIDYQYQHKQLIPDSSNNTLILEAASRGLGNGSYGPGTLEQYCIKYNTTYKMEFIMK